jgi:hypothetical protein
MPYAVHLYVDTENAPASAVGDSILSLAEEQRSALIVVAAHNVRSLIPAVPSWAVPRVCFSRATCVLQRICAALILDTLVGDVGHTCHMAALEVLTSGS